MGRPLERTSKEAASAAGKVLALSTTQLVAAAVRSYERGEHGAGPRSRAIYVAGYVAGARAALLLARSAAASALTQREP